MRCAKCKGRMFLDRTFSDNKNYEAFCILCGERKFINKNTDVGQWIQRREAARESAASRVG